MIIEIDSNSGFCFGVVNAIGKAEKELKERGYVNSLGDIVHNKMEIARLEKIGLTTISHQTLHKIKGDTVFIRAHGEPPATFKTALDLGYKIVDATCPVVSRLQRRVLEAYSIMSKVGGQVVILGKRGHAEVIGLSGQIDNNCVIIESVAELEAIVDFSRPIYLLSQTTQPLSLFKEVSRVIEQKRTPEHNGDYYIIKDTICRNVSDREPLLRNFAAKYDLILFVSGTESSNGKALFAVCKSINSNSYKIECESDINPQWLDGVASIGICGATSTPRWLMERISASLAYTKF